MRATWLVMALLIGCKPTDDYGKGPGAKRSSPSTAEQRAEWERSKAADKAKRVQLTDKGQEPRRLLCARDLEVGEPASADIEVESTTRIGRPHEEPMVHTSKARGTLMITMRTPEGDEHAGSFEVRDLVGSMKNLDKLQRKGTFEPGLFGEPWLVVVQAGGGTGGTNEELVWERDLKGWLRTVLMPIPQEPVGVGATWFGEWTDYLGGDAINERREYKLVSLDETTAEITVSATTSASEAAGSSSSWLVGTISLPLGARGVPSLDARGDGSALLQDPRGALEVTSSSKLTVRPHVQ
ncbi:MAG: hypothetical protein SFX73_06975 [Kofleriaceae bacterium]|nr:hypothetical protein [Kofleriaceae bacterium]